MARTTALVTRAGDTTGAGSAGSAGSAVIAVAATPGQWLVDQLREEQRAADRRRLTELLTAHALPRPRAGA